MSATRPAPVPARRAHRRDQSLAGPGDRLRGSVHGRARRDDRERRPALDPARTALLGHRPAVGDQRLHAAVRWLSAARRAGRRPAGSPAPVHGRRGPVLGRLGAERAGHVARPLLVAGRALQGLGGALVSPAALSILTTTFTESTERTPARWGCGAVSPPAASAVGLLLGGVAHRPCCRGSGCSSSTCRSARSPPLRQRCATSPKVARRRRASLL